MTNRYKKNWHEAQTKWKGYWNQKNSGRPVMNVVARKPEIEHLFSEAQQKNGEYLATWQGNYYNLPEELMWHDDMQDKYQNADRMVARYRQFCENHLFLAESFPNLCVDFGPGSLAAYLGSEIGFSDDTVWFLPCFEKAASWKEVPPLTFNPENKWFKKHYNLIKRCQELSKGDFFVDIPDMMENIDVLASLRDTQPLLFDLIDDPDEIKNRINQVTTAYYQCLSRFYETVQDTDGSTAYTVFQIWGPGKTVKLQCDIGAMLSPQMFRDMVQESLREQAQYADSVLYHLDGPDNIRHLDAIMEIDEIQALQWTSGDHGPDGTIEEWDAIYDKARATGKSLWIKVYDGGVDGWIKSVDRIVQKYGSHSLFLWFPEMSYDDAQKLLAHADAHWSDIEGTFSA